MQIGIVGKPNVGKSTFFSAATMANVEIANYPFTTIEANIGIGYLRASCPCRELDVKCEPRNSACINGVRMIPIELLDVAGLVPDAWQGRGLGNQFLDDLRQADALVNVTDASGSTDIEGNPVDIAAHDPLEDVEFLEKEVDRWIQGILAKGFDRIARQIHLQGTKIESALHERLTGLGINETDIHNALKDVSPPDNPQLWGDDVMYSLAKAIRIRSKPMIVAMNKADIAPASNLKRISESGRDAVPTMAEAELALRRAEKAGLIDYMPGDKSFTIKDPSVLSEGQRKALDYIAENMKRFGGTGVQRCLEKAAYDMLGLIVCYPVEDENKYTDHDGRVLPDALLMPRGSKARDLAYKVHTDLGEGFIRAVNARTKRVVGHDYQLMDGDIIKIVSKR
ncbi:MAG: ribosome-binding ATPase [Candidatus Methanomethylophilaceae archaeon]|nr:ribosome-binding ATPase [Candidatus Methanomethylophilaceae archaeon]MDI3541513.1 ribosome-binding ATPase [Candidatus Methanomethylophilaceae archaeon]HIJ00343.1 redox-regulated ATPase YchF [Candidatus Methanomethylophilaceae archaeon]